MICTGKTLKHETFVPDQVYFFSNVFPCPSLSSVGTDERKQFPCLNIDLLNNSSLRVPLCLEFNFLNDGCDKGFPQVARDFPN